MRVRATAECTIEGCWSLLASANYLRSADFQYCDISSVAHCGCCVTPLGANSFMYGLMSMTGVLSIASKPSTSIDKPDTCNNLQTVTPKRLGLFFARCAKTPTSGQSLR